MYCTEEGRLAYGQTKERDCFFVCMYVCMYVCIMWVIGVT